MSTKNTCPVVGAHVILGEKHRGNKNTKQLLVARIGCTEHDLTSGELKVSKVDVNGNLEIQRPNLAGVNQPVHPKYFEAFTAMASEQSEQETVAA